MISFLFLNNETSGKLSFFFSLEPFKDMEQRPCELERLGRKGRLAKFLQVAPAALPRRNEREIPATKPRRF